MGITEGAKWAYLLTINSINLLVDSQSAITAIESANSKSHCIRLCMQGISTFSVGNSVKIIWILVHIRIEGNENAD